MFRRDGVVRILQPSFMKSMQREHRCLAIPAKLGHQGALILVRDGMSDDDQIPVTAFALLQGIGETERRSHGISAGLKKKLPSLKKDIVVRDGEDLFCRHNISQQDWMDADKPALAYCWVFYGKNAGG